MRKNDPKTKLADAFIDLASREGAYRITLEAVAKKARVPFSTAHYHLKALGVGLVEFGLREVGVRAQAYIQAFLERAGRESPKGNPLHDYVIGSFAWARELRPHASIWLFQYHLIAVNEATREAHQIFLDAALERIEKLIFESVGKGFYPERTRRPGKTRDAAIAVHSLLIGGMTRALVSSTDSKSPHSALESHERIVLSTIDCLLKSAPGEARSVRSARPARSPSAR
jgi:AcrR family transcriptional regulator